MNKKTIRALAFAAAALILLLAVGLPLLSKLYYGRSWNATMFAWQFRKEAYTTEEVFADYLAQKRAENAEKYAIPQNTTAYTRFVKQRYAGMTFYTINSALPADGQVILYFPGGSYIDEPREVHWEFLTRLADETGAMVAVPLYPKLPDNDASSAYAALTDAYTEFLRGMVYGELVFMGDSAGGGMALSFAMQLRDAGLKGPDRLILLCPWLDVTLTNPDIPACEKKDPALDSEQLRHLGALWAGELSPTDPVVSPLYGSFEGLGRITLFTGTSELLYPDILRLDGALTAAGIEHALVTAPGMFHVWPLYVRYHFPEAAETFAQIADMLRSAPGESSLSPAA